MDMHARHQLTEQVLIRYLKADKEEKGRILDEYCANTGYGRKYAIGKLRRFQTKPSAVSVRHRIKTYDMSVEEAIHAIWDAYDMICAERLHPSLPACIAKLVACKELTVDAAIEEKIRRMSLGTLKILLRKIRVRATGRVSGTTKPGTLLKHEIPLRVGLWDETSPGFLEIDTVAHCGSSLTGIFAHTLNSTDISTGWFEAEAVLGKAQERVHAGIVRIRERLPVTLKGLDSDNGYEFINWELYRWCEAENIVFTRSRPYKKNDNAHIEQKNWTCVRRVLEYGRIETQEQVDLMNELYRGPLRDYINFFLPSMKCVKRTRIGSKIVKEYDTAQTPYERILYSGCVSAETKEKLRMRYAELNPVDLKRQIAFLKKRIFGTIR